MSKHLNKPVNQHLDNATVAAVFFFFGVVFALIIGLTMYAYNLSRNRATYVNSPATSARLTLQRLAREASADEGDDELEQLLKQELSELE